MTTHVAVPRDQAQKLVDYLKDRPYVEVYTLIEALRQAPPVRLEAPAPQAEEPKT